ncbi:MAG: hypothetical protein LDL30_01320 [Desulfovibrio sp.]|nr:hypothetical protein [Desulfovibrio sp.]MCA1985002.1 hypothetical protein [Desulfovibrio sp.]
MFSIAPHDDTQAPMAPMASLASLASLSSLSGDGFPGMASAEFMTSAANAPSLRFQKPALFLLSSLFRADYLGKRTQVSAHALATVARAKVLLYTGETLDQFDLDILLYCAQQPRAATGCMVAPAQLLKELHLRHDERNRTRLFESLARLHGACLEVRKGGYRYLTRLLNRLLLDDTATSCLVEVNDEILQTLGRSPQQGARRQDRYALGREGFDKWLHGAMSIFAAGFEADVSRLQQLMGQERRPQKAFLDDLARSLDRLRAADCIAGHELALDGPAPRVVICGQRHQTINACGFLQQAAD